MKWIHLTAQTKTQEDFTLLTKLLDALGLKARDLERYSRYTLQSFLPEHLMLEVVHRKEPRTDSELALTVSDPDSAAQVIRKMGLKIVDDSSGPEPSNSVRHFRVILPGGTTIDFTGFRSAPGREYGPAIQGGFNGEGKKFALVVSRFNSFITERLLAGAMNGLTQCGATEVSDIVRVPGSFEIPSAARTLAETRKYDAIICLGCLLRGDTAHYDVIVNEVTRGIGQSAQETGVPHAFGVLTCDTLEQAIDRAGLKMGNKGFEAALAAVEMSNLKKAIVGRQSPAVGKKEQIPRGLKPARNDKPGGFDSRRTVYDRKAEGARSKQSLESQASSARRDRRKKKSS